MAWSLDKDDIFVPTLLGKLQGLGTAKICDIGCGNGALLEILQKAGNEVIGVEPDEQARQLANTRGLRVLNGSAEELPRALEQGTFDVVLMIHSLEHVIDKRCGIPYFA